MDGVLLGEYVLRWLHLLFGFTWIGLLYYFNLVQIPSLKNLSPEAKAEVFKEGSIARTALFYFRWAAVGTVLVGLALLGHKGVLVHALTLSGPISLRGLGIGCWLGIVMLLNVWVFIWPNQKKVVGIVPATAEEKAAAGRTAMLVSRTNFMLSIPMLFFMEAFSHGLT
jgi:uncharacterized membrane protein